MNKGQIYNIKIIEVDKNQNKKTVAIKKAKLIFEGNHFYTFEYKSKSGEMFRTTIDKFEYKSNPGLIQEA